MKPKKYVWELYHENELIFTSNFEMEVYKKLLNVSPFSTQWSIQHCGYRIEKKEVPEE